MTDAPDPCLIYDDPREIEMVLIPGVEDACWRVGFGCDRIVAYREHGQADWVPYFAVYTGDEIMTRIPASLVVVDYARSISLQQ